MKQRTYQRDTALVPWRVYNTVLSSGPASEAAKPKLLELCHVFQHDMVFSMLIISLLGIILHMFQFASVLHHLSHKNTRVKASVLSGSLLEENLCSSSADVPLSFHEISV